MRIAITAAVTLAFTLALAACGFQMRGTASLPFDKLYLPPRGGGIALDLKRNIQAGTHTTVVEDPKQADAVMEFSQELREKRILSLGVNGRVREYQLIYTVGFRVHDGKGAEYLPTNQVVLTRDVTFNDSDVLSKETEEALLYRDMQNDMVQQIMRRIASSQPPKPAAQ